MTTSSSATLKRLRLETLHAYGGECTCCGATYWNHLELDHIHGDGAEHRRQWLGDRKYGAQHAIFRWLRDHNYPKGDFQVLCRSCNFAKGNRERCNCSSAVTVTEELTQMPARKRPGMPGAGRPPIRTRPTT